MLYTTPIVAQLIGEEPGYDLRQNRATLLHISLLFPHCNDTYTPKTPSSQLKNRQKLPVLAGLFI